MPCVGFGSTFALGTLPGEKETLCTWLEGRCPDVPRSPGLFDARGQLLHKVVDRAVLADHARDLGGGVDHGRMVAAAELAADLRQRGVRQLAREVHRHLPGVDDV